MKQPFTIKQDHELIREYKKWILVRKSLNLTSFGMNMVVIPPGERIPEHDEKERDHEEVFIILEGNGTMIIDDKQYPAPKGTFIRLDPSPKRTVANESDIPIKVLIISAPTTSGYTPLDWA